MDKKRETTETAEKAKATETAETIRGDLGRQGCLLGVILWCSSLFYLSLTNNAEGMLAFLPWMIPALFGYLAAGTLMEWFFFYKKRIGGLSAVYWCWGAGLLLTALGSHIRADWIRFMLLTNVLVLIGVFAGNYWWLGRLAKKLNGSKRPLTLCIPLREKPVSQEAFFAEFEKYCAKERISLRYETKELPAIVWMDGQRCEIRLDSEPGLGGAEYYINCRIEVRRL